MPGETAVPGTSGTARAVVGSAVTATSGIAYTVTVNGVDMFWNINTVANHQVTITTSDNFDTQPTAAVLVNGVKTFDITLRTAGTSNITVSDTDTSTTDDWTSSSYSSLPILPNSITKLQLILPGETAVAGSTYAGGITGTASAASAGTNYSVTVNSVDNNWNINSSGGRNVKVETSDTNDSEPSASLSNGAQTLNVVFKTSGNWTLTAKDNSGSSALWTQFAHSAITVNPSPAVKLQMVLPGETAAPGTTNAGGVVGTAWTETAGVQFTVTINAVDSDWNLNTSANQTVELTTSDSNAVISGNPRKH